MEFTLPTNRSSVYKTSYGLGAFVPVVSRTWLARNDEIKIGQVALGKGT